MRGVVEWDGWLVVWVRGVVMGREKGGGGGGGGERDKGLGGRQGGGEVRFVNLRDTRRAA